MAAAVEAIGADDTSSSGFSVSVHLAFESEFQLDPDEEIQSDISSEVAIA